MQERESRPPPEHVPRPPIGSAPFDSTEGEEGGVLVIGPDGDEGVETTEGVIESNVEVEETSEE